MDKARQALVEILQEVRVLLAISGNDFAWSSWENAAEALAEIDRHVAAIEGGALPSRLDLSVLFAPTGPIQEVSLSSGWAREFLALSARFDTAEERAYA